MSEYPLDDAELRLERANEKIADLEDAIRAFLRTNPYVVWKDVQSNPGYERYKIRMVKSLPNSLRILAQEIIDHTRAPLDYAVTATAEKVFHAEPRFLKRTGFPFAPSAEKFEAELKDRKIHLIDSGFADFIRTFQPYKGGNELLFNLNELRNPQTHRKLNAIAMFGGMRQVFREVKSTGLFASKTPTWNAVEDGSVFLETSVGTQFDGDIQFAVSVAFAKLEGFEDRPMNDLLRTMIAEVERVIGEFRRRFFENNHE